MTVRSTTAEPTPYDHGQAAQRDRCSPLPNTPQVQTMLTTYCVARIDGCGTITRLTDWQSFDACDDAIDQLQDRYPAAIVDIFTNEECPDL